jgi:site-specific recombinase XerD
MGRRTRSAIKPVSAPRPTGWAETIEQFADHLADRERSEATVRGYRYNLRLFTRWYALANDGDEPELTTIDAADLRSWKTWMQVERKMLPQSVNRPLAAMQGLLEWGQSHEWCQSIQMPRTVVQETPPPRWLTKNEQHALERAVTAGGVPRDIALVKLLLYAGLRISEAASLKWNQVHVGERTGEVTVTGKGRKRRTIPLGKEVRPSLIALAKVDGQVVRVGSQPVTLSRLGSDKPVFEGREGALTAKTLWRIVGRYGHATKLYDLSPHVLRHTYCHNLAMEGGRLESIAALAGHESIETTRRYVEPGMDDLRALVERLGGREDEAEQPRGRRR